MNNNYGQHTINTTKVNDGTNRASKQCCHRESSLQYSIYYLYRSICINRYTILSIIYHFYTISYISINGGYPTYLIKLLTYFSYQCDEIRRRTTRSTTD